MRIKLSGDFGFLVISLIAIGIFYGVLSWLIENVLLFNVPREKRADHILSKIALWITFILVILDVLLVVLPVFGIQLLPITLLDLI